MEPFIGQIGMFAGSFAPRGWAICRGQLLPISQYDALYSLLGTTYGGDGVTTFGLPDLQGRTPVHQGTNQSQTYPIGSSGGVESVPLIPSQVPVHTHALQVADVGTSTDPANNVLAGTAALKQFVPSSAANASLNQAAISPFPGGNQPHENRHPFLVINFIIALEGIYPSRN